MEINKEIECFLQTEDQIEKADIIKSIIAKDKNIKEYFLRILPNFCNFNIKKCNRTHVFFDCKTDKEELILIPLPPFLRHKP